tara:strand:- start:827 stop:1039 length:213 start_codon:yes stop_codon:yes gene_type:complete
MRSVAPTLHGELLEVGVEVTAPRQPLEVGGEVTARRQPLEVVVEVTARRQPLDVVVGRCWQVSKTRKLLL